MGVSPKKQSLKDELKADRRVEGPKPKIIRILNSMTAEDRKEWEDILVDPDVDVGAICRALEKRGHLISRPSIYRYRSGNFVRREP